MATPKHPIPDRRSAPRTNVVLGCRISFEGKEYEGVIQNISLVGAFLWSSFIPPNDAMISIKLDKNSGADSLSLEGNVVRRDNRDREKEAAGTFAIMFSHNSPGLLRLMDTLIKPQK
jgi:hypothetical protein